MTGPGSVLVVGGGLAAARAVGELRALGADSRITLVCAEPHPPYDRPPLSKQVLRGERTDTSLRPAWDDLDVDLRLGVVARALSPADRTLLLEDGSSLDYDALVIATGACPRVLPTVAGTGVHVLRTIDDALGLAADIRRAGRVVVVGGGLIGCEVAASARVMGAEVTVIELLETPLARVLGARVGIEMTKLHENAGVRVLTGTAVEGARGDGADRQLLLSGGATLAAPVVLIALGVAPATGWLEGSGVALRDGVVCDEHGRTSVPDVWAAGDVARWWQPGEGIHLRMEHWTSAADQGISVARDLLRQEAPPPQLPYFWTDQYGITFQLFGRPDVGDEVTITFVGPDRDRLLAVYGRDGRVTAAFGGGVPRWLLKIRKLIAAGGSYEEALALAR